jgi:hypothetical protein
MDFHVAFQTIYIRLTYQFVGAPKACAVEKERDNSFTIFHFSPIAAGDCNPHPSEPQSKMASLVNWSASIRFCNLTG